MPSLLQNLLSSLTATKGGVSSTCRITDMPDVCDIKPVTEDHGERTLTAAEYDAARLWELAHYEEEEEL